MGNKQAKPKPGAKPGAKPAADCPDPCCKPAAGAPAAKPAAAPAAQPAAQPARPAEARAPPPKPAAAAAKPAAASPNAKRPAQVAGAAIARSQEEAYELDAADGVIDGKFYGAEVRIVPPGQGFPTPPAPAQQPTGASPSRNEARGMYPRPPTGGSPVRAPSPSYAPASPHLAPSLAHAYSTHPSRSFVPGDYAGPGKVIGVEYRQLSGSGTRIPAADYYSSGTYVEPSVARSYSPRGRGATGEGVTRFEYRMPQYQAPTYTSQAPTYTRAYGALPASASLPLASAPPKSYYDTYSRFAKVDFHTIGKSPYGHLLGNQQSQSVVSQTQDYAIPPSAAAVPQNTWVSLGPETAPAVVEQPIYAPQQFAPQHAPQQYASQQLVFPVPQAPPMETLPLTQGAPYTLANANQPWAGASRQGSELTAVDSREQSAAIAADSNARAAFRRYDADFNGLLDIFEFMAALKQLGITVTFKEAQRLFSEVDLNRDGFIVEEEFVGWYRQSPIAAQANQTNQASQDPRRLASAVFQKYDTDRDGCLNEHEFVAAMQELGFGYSLEDAQQVLDSFDATGNAVIDEQKFVDLYYELLQEQR